MLMHDKNKQKQCSRHPYRTTLPSLVLHRFWYSLLPMVTTYMTSNSHNSGVTDHLTKGSFVRNGVVRIPKFDARP